jgi:hypothetical protein
MTRAAGILALALLACEREDGRGPETRGRFMAILGLLAGGAFTLVILALWLPTFWLHPCQ